MSNNEAKLNASKSAESKSAEAEGKKSNSKEACKENKTQKSYASKKEKKEGPAQPKEQEKPVDVKTKRGESITKDVVSKSTSKGSSKKKGLPMPTIPVDQARLLADAEAKAKVAKTKISLKDFIKKHFTITEGIAMRMDYELDTLHALLDISKYEFLKAPPLLEFSAPVNICGDIHGQYGDLMRIFNTCGMPFTNRYLFLGDYVDRGRHSLEVITLLLALRAAYPKKVFLLRGNHELPNINKVYGFLADIRNRFRGGTEFKPLYDHFNEVFAVMPLAAVVSQKILCMHGGLSPELNSLDDIRKLSRPITTVRGLAQDLLWADPEAGIPGFQANKIRAVSHVFGEEAVAMKCKQLNVDMVVRAHQVVEFGYAFFANRQLITVFSAARYHEDLWNYAAVVQVGAHLEMHVVQLKPQEYEQYRREKQQQAVATGDRPDDDDEGK